MVRIKKSLLLIVDVIRSSFISLVPYYILYSFIVLFVESLKHFNLVGTILTLDDLNSIITLMSSILPLLLNIAISYHIATFNYITTSRLLMIILSLIIFLSIEIFAHHMNMESNFLPHSITLAIIIPFLSTMLLAKIIGLLKQYENKLSHLLSSNITTMIIYIIPFSLVYFIITFILTSLDIFLDIETSMAIFDSANALLLLFIRTVVSNFLWIFGIHGINFFDSIINVDILNNDMFPNLSFGEFFNLFVLFGGSGSTLSLIFAIFLVSKDRHTSFIGKVAMPFAVFNINEILIFGIPIFMNFFLIIPFILVPVVNFIVSYLFISFTPFISFADIYIPWTTPALINGYLASNGNIIIVFLQLFLIALGTLIYIPYIKKYTSSQSSRLSLENMARKLEVSTSVEFEKDIRFQEAQSSLIKSHHKVNKIIDKINQNNLILYYQPKIDTKTNTINDFEALIRVKEKDGKITGPDFIIDIENSGLASILDIWVCNEVKKDLDVWAEKGFYPHICINLFPYTLEDVNYVNEIINILKGYDVGFEILERRSALNKKVHKNLHLLKKNNFKISLDDLGVGYTNFSMLYELPLDIVKIDKKIIEFTNTEKGLILYKHIRNLCKSLNLKIVLEGIETKEEYDRLVNKDISYVQGWYYSKAIPFDEVEEFSRKFNE